MMATNDDDDKIFSDDDGDRTPQKPVEGAETTIIRTRIRNQTIVGDENNFEGNKCHKRRRLWKGNQNRDNADAAMKRMVRTMTELNRG